MANTHALIYDLPSDKVTGTWSQVGGTVNPLYPLTNLDDGKPWNPTVFTVNPTSIVIDFGSAKRVDLVSFLHVNFDLGAVIHVQMNASNSWGSPTVDVAVGIAGPTEDAMPAQPFVDLTVATGYTTSGLRYLRIQIVSGQVSLLSIGMIRLTSIRRQLAIGVQWGGKDKELHPVIERLTDAGVQMGYSRGTRARVLTSHLQTTDTGFAELQSASRATGGRLRPFLLIYDPTINEARWVKWGPTSGLAFERVLTFLNLDDLELDWEEVGRGLAP